LQAAALGPPVSAESFPALKELNFVWPDEPQDPRSVWRAVEAMPAEELRRVREAARRELSPEAVLQGHLSAIGRTNRGRPPGPALLDGVIDLSLALDDAQAAAQRVADGLWAARADARSG
jgi:hypothetical protein